jgi:hypothetical protein
MVVKPKPTKRRGLLRSRLCIAMAPFNSVDDCRCGPAFVQQVGRITAARAGVNGLLGRSQENRSRIVLDYRGQGVLPASDPPTDPNWPPHRSPSSLPGQHASDAHQGQPATWRRSAGRQVPSADALLLVVSPASAGVPTPTARVDAQPGKCEARTAAPHNARSESTACRRGRRAQRTPVPLSGKCSVSTGGRANERSRQTICP